jgi:hypothetical protein
MDLVMKSPLRFDPWVIPLRSAVPAVAGELICARIEGRILPGIASTVTIPAALAIYSFVASGMLAPSGGELSVCAQRI